MGVVGGHAAAPEGGHVADAGHKALLQLVIHEGLLQEPLGASICTDPVLQLQYLLLDVGQVLPNL